jgi:hypothetical protein
LRNRRFKPSFFPPAANSPNIYMPCRAQYRYYSLTAFG